MLRAQKLGEADRIVTLLTRGHGRVRARRARACARTSSRIGARLEPFSHVDVQLYEGRSPRHRDAGRDDRGARRGARRRDYPRYTAGDRDARDGRAADRRGARAARAAVPRCSSAGLRSLVAARARPRPDPRRLPAAVARRSPAGRPRFEDCARCGAAGPAPRLLRVQPAAWSAPAAGRPGRRHRPRRPSPCSAPCSAATGRWPTPASRASAGRRSGLVAAFLQWHLERGLRSLPLVDRSSD